MNEQNERICRFLSRYVEIQGGGLLPSDERFLKDGIMQLIDNCIMTKDEIKREALREYNVIVPEHLFAK